MQTADIIVCILVRLGFRVLCLVFLSAMWPSAHGAVQGSVPGGMTTGAYQGVVAGAVQGGVAGAAQPQGGVQNWGATATAQAPTDFAGMQSAGIYN